jgi:hypothetical protein
MFSVLHVLSVVVRAAIVAAFAAGAWTYIHPTRPYEHLIFGFFAFVVCLIAEGRRRTRIVRGDDIILSLEQSGKTDGPSPTLLRADAENRVVDAWRSELSEHSVNVGRAEVRQLSALVSSMVIPALLAGFMIWAARPSFSAALDTVANVVAALARGASIRVVQGNSTTGYESDTALSPGRPVEIELLSQNLVELKYRGTRKESAPTVELKKEDGAIFQTFQMSQIRDDQSSDADRIYSVTFAVDETVGLFIPVLSQDKLATIKVRQLPVPRVKLAGPMTPDGEPWPDDQLLPLEIEAKSENPLQVIQLVIRSGSRTSKELVNRVMAEDKTEIATSYSLLLEPFVESDVAEVEIVAEAIDRSLPSPLVGRSQPFRITTASAYGRYRETLRTLRELKSAIDEQLNEVQPQLQPEMKEMADKAAKQAENSPFFDGLDRVQISRFPNMVGDAKDENSSAKMMDLSNELNNFLFEHEILDDRERDRDFFVAARSLSRLIEQAREKRAVAVPKVLDRMNTFLDDRNERWRMRVERLPPERQPKQAATTLDGKPFHKAMANIRSGLSGAEETVQMRNAALKNLSETVVQYRQWIEDLEAAEDQHREQQEKQRQEGLANAQNELKELQKRQGEISQKLDRSIEKMESQKEQLDEEWPATRMSQNANIKDTRRLENQLRSLSPTAGARIKAAIEAMEGTLENGNNGKYPVAESASDLAGRLLRQAESAAQNSQKRQRNRGRRRQVTGDNYYGQSVVGGDIEIKREYQVDRRYREDILQEVQSSNVEEENKVLLDNYLRQVIR